MEKIFIGEKEYKMGDKILITGILTKDVIEKFIKAGILTVASPKQSDAPTVPMDLEYYIGRLAERKKISYRAAEDTIKIMLSIYPVTGLSTLLREIAVELDKKYSDHIESSDKLFVVSMANGCITEIPKNSVRNFKNFAAFRTIEDAKVACKIVSPILRDMFKKNGK